MGNKEKIDYLLADIRELEKLVASMRDAEIYPISFFSQSFATAQKIISGLHSIESDQVALFSRQMQEHKALLTEKEQTVPFTSPVREQAIRMITPTKINSNPKFFNKPFMCVYFNRLLYSSHKLTHNSLTDEIFFAKKPLISHK